MQNNCETKSNESIVDGEIGEYRRGGGEVK